MIEYNFPAISRVFGSIQGAVDKYLKVKTSLEERLDFFCDSQQLPNALCQSQSPCSPNFQRGNIDELLCQTVF